MGDTYDGLGRTVGVKADGTATEALSFSFVGSRLDTATSTDADGKTITQTYGYGSDGRLTSEEMTQGCFSANIGYQYDGLGRLQYLIYPSGLRVEYIYEVMGGMNRLAQVKVKQGDFTENLATFEYDATSGARTKVVFASQSRTDWSVDAVGRPFAWSLKNRAGTEVRAGAYAFNGGQITSAGDWKDMTYDNLGRITGATSTFAGRPTITATMAHDGFGNQIRNVSSPVSGDMLTWSLDPDDANLKGHNWMPLTTKTDVLASVDTGWSTNAQGEAEVVGMGTGGVDLLAMQWDKLGRLNRVRCETKNLEQKYSYAPSGLRVDRKDIRVPDSSRKFVYTTEGMLLSVLNGQGAWVKDVVYAGGEALAEIDATGIHELHNDHLGTPKMVTNRNTGLVEGEYLYGPYGELVATKPGNNGSTYPITTGYTGHLSQDSTGLIYMRGRYYSPTWHRFVNSDQGVDPMSFNQMAYVGGDPFGAMDPSGMKKMKKGEQYVDSYGRTWTCVADECDTDTSNVKGAGWELNGTVEVIGAHPGKAHPGKDEAIWNYNLTYFGTANLNWRNIHPSYGSPNSQTPRWVDSSALANDCVNTLAGFGEHAPGNISIATAATKTTQAGKIYWNWLKPSYQGGWAKAVKVGSFFEAAGKWSGRLGYVKPGYNILSGNGSWADAGDIAFNAYTNATGVGGAIIQGTKIWADHQWKDDGGYPQMLQDAGSWYGDSFLGTALQDAANYYRCNKK